jgi:hypothetical protein
MVGAPIILRNHKNSPEAKSTKKQDDWIAAHTCHLTEDVEFNEESDRAIIHGEIAPVWTSASGSIPGTPVTQQHIDGSRGGIDENGQRSLNAGSFFPPMPGSRLMTPSATPAPAGGRTRTPFSEHRISLHGSTALIDGFLSIDGNQVDSWPDALMQLATTAELWESDLMNFDLENIV